MNTIPENALHFPATRRNREAISAILADVLPASGLVLEVASGSGEHIVHFSSLFPALTWQPSDPDPENLASIRAWAEAQSPRHANLLPPLPIDASDERLPLDGADAVICINMIHIAPWGATRGLMRNAARLLPAQGALYLYGPFMIDGLHTAPSNEAFDRQLRLQDETWGVRDLREVTAEARRHGLHPAGSFEMPANNLSAVFRKAEAGGRRHGASSRPM